MINNLPDSSPVLTIQQAADILDVSTKTLRRWDKTNILVPTRTQGNQRRYTREQINTFKNRRPLPYGYPSALTSSHLEGVDFAKSDLASQHLPGDPLRQSVSEASRMGSWKVDVGRKFAVPNIFKVTAFVFGLSILVGLLTFSLSGKMGKGESQVSPSRSPFGHLEGAKLGHLEGVGLAGGEVLQASTIDNTLLFNVNIPSRFAEDAEFLKGISAVEIATLSGGIITEDSDIDAGTGTLTASNVLYGATAGSGISVSSGQIPTITNTDLGSSQKIFKTIKVGSSSFSSGSNTDTLEFAAGSNITLSSDTSNKKVTIAGSSPTSAGWTDDGTVVRLTTSTDSVGIGTTSPDTKLHIAGTFKVTGATTLNGVSYTWPSADGSSNYLLSTNGSGTLSWLSSGGTVNFWQRNSGALSPFNITDDLLLGATSTASAKFSVLNIAGGTPTASVSANSGNIATYLTGDGTLATTNRQSLTIGNSSTYNTTGNVLINPNGTGFVGIGTTSPGQLLDVAGIARINIITPQSTDLLRVGGDFDDGIGRGSEIQMVGCCGDNADVTISVGDSTNTNQGSLTINNKGGTAGSSTGAIKITNLNVGIGDTTPDSILEILSTTTPQFRITYTDTTVDTTFAVSSTGDLTIDALGGGTTEQLILADTDILNIGGSGSTDVAYNVIGDSTSGASSSMDSDDDLYIEGNLEVDGSFIAPASGTSGYWQRASGALSPTNITDDLLLGATSTASAKFSVLNIAGGTPTASVSANSGNNATFLTGLGNLATTNAQTLTLGGSTTGNITMDAGVGNITLSDDTTITGDLAVNGATSADITSTTTTGTLFNTTVTTLSLGGAATTLNLGTTDSVTRTINLGTGTGADTINIGTGATTANTVNIGTGAVANTIAIGSASSTGVSITDDNWSVSTGGVITISPGTTGTFLDFALETEWTSGTLINADFASATTQGAAAIVGALLNLNTNLTTPAAGQDVTGVNVQLPLASTTSNATLYTGYNLSGTGSVTNATAGSFAWRGANITLPAITQSAGGSVTASGLRVLVPASAAITTAGTMNAIDVIAPTTSGPAAGTLTGLNIAALTSPGAGTENAITIGSGWDMGVLIADNMLIGFGTAAGRIEFDDQATDEVNILSANVGIGTASPISELHVTRALAAGVTGKALAIFDQIESQDILTASASGTTKFVLDNAGKAYLGALDLETANTTATCWFDNTINGATLKEITDCNGAPTDLAENFGTSDTSIEAGDVVVITGEAQKITVRGTPTSKAFIKKSETPYQSTLLGVVSTAPSELYGDDGVFDPSDNPRPVSLAGRVPVKVSIENGAIASGDTITSSSIQGVAMKATRAGQVIGKALESFSQDGIGKIIVFVNLSWHDPAVYIAADGNLSGVNQELGIMNQGENTSSISIIPDSSFMIQNGSSTGSAEVTFDLGSNELFKNLTDKVALLEARINNLAETSFSASTSALLSVILGTSEERTPESLTAVGDAGQDGYQTVTRQASMTIEDLDVRNATVSGALIVLGRTTLSDLGVTGNINAGLLSIHGLDDITSEVCSGSNLTSEVDCVGATINTLSGNLYLQNEGLGGIDILSGKVVIDTKGNIVTQGEITARKVNVDESDTSSKSVGDVIIKAGETKVEIKTTSLTSKSHIFATPDRPVAVGTKQKDEGSFTIALKESLPEDVKVNWWVVN